MTRSWQGFTPNQVVRRLGIIGPLRILILYNNFWTFCSLPWLIFGCFLSVFTHFECFFIFEYSSFEYSYFASFWCLTFPLNISSLMDVLLSHEYIISYGCSFFTKSSWISLLYILNDFFCLYLNDLLLEWSYPCIFTFCNFEFLIGYFSLITIFLNGWTESSSWLTLPLLHIFEFSRIHSLIFEWFVRVVNDSLYTFLIS